MKTLNGKISSIPLLIISPHDNYLEQPTVTGKNISSTWMCFGNVH